MRNAVRFLLGREERTLSDFDPTMTVLEYLRGPAHRTGTKEGCAEGDCGACTVVLAEPDKNGHGLRYRAVNSCIQFLPALDGKQLLTVEDLRNEKGRLHPVQTALCRTHGSQCGFCTPGIVMSLFAMEREGGPRGRDNIREALAGNLCRCTGYGPVIAAAADVRKRREEPFDADESATVERLNALGDVEMIAIEKDNRRYFAPASLQELMDLLEQNPEARIVGGTTDVGLWVTKQHRELDVLVSVSRVRELKRISVGQSHIEIGAGVTLTDAHEVLATHYPDLDELLMRFASRQIRNVATVGGNIANGSPIGDLAPALIALDASLVLRAGSERRRIPLESFFLEYGKQDRRPGEFVETIEVPLPSGEEVFACYKISKRFEQDISALCGAFRVRIGDGKVTDVRVAFGGMAGTPQRARSCEAALFGQTWSQENVETAMEALKGDFTPLDDMRASARYRRLAAANLLLKFWLESSGNAPERRVSEMSGGDDGHH